jgi:hypothetical protein
MNENILYDCNAEIAARAAAEALTRRGFRVVRSFDLRSALTPLAAHSNCECPHHGTAQCTCQFVVLLVYGDPATGSGGAPVVVTAHSREAQAQVQIVRDADARPDARLVEQVLAGLFEAALAVLPCPAEAPADAHQAA